MRPKISQKACDMKLEPTYDRYEEFIARRR